MKFVYAFMFMFSILFSSPVWSQVGGVIHCQEGRVGAMALEQPNSLVVVRMMECGQDVSIIGAGQGYVQIRINEHLAGFVEANQVIANGPLPATFAKIVPTARQVPVMGRSATHTSPWNWREDYAHVFELLIGYSAMNLDFREDREFVHGWNTAVSVNLNDRFALEADVSGYYKSRKPIITEIYPPDPEDSGHIYWSYGESALNQTYFILGGPRLNFGPGFVHALVGAGIDRYDGTGSTAFASALGGGVQFRINDRMSFRLGVDYMPIRSNSTMQHNFRTSGGLVFKFGER